MDAIQTTTVSKWKLILVSIVALVVFVVLYLGGRYIYRNTYAEQEYQYSSKQYEGELLDSNVIINKKIKRNNSKGEINLVFDKKVLSEEYQFTLGSEVTPVVAKISVIGKINAGNVNVKMLNENNTEIFNRTVSGNNIEQISTQDSYSKTYRLILTPDNAKNGELEIKFNFK